MRAKPLHQRTLIILELDWIVDRLNENILKDQSSARVTELDLMHSVVINGRADRATIDYSVLLEGTISNYRIGDKDSDGRQLIDLGWRGLSVYEPTVVDGIEINLPISAIENHVPSVYDMIRGTDAEVLLSKPIMDGSAILEQGLDSWHFLFDSTGTNIDAERYGLDESIEGVIYSRYTMGESSIREGIKTEIEETATIDLDTRYSFTTIQSSDNANLHIVGYAAIDTLDDLEIAGVTTTKIDSDTSTGDFPALIVYGMAGMAVVGGIVFFIVSGRQLKREEVRGRLDPSRLTGYQTSASAGGLRTRESIGGSLSHALVFSLQISALQSHVPSHRQELCIAQKHSAHLLHPHVASECAAGCSGFSELVSL